MNKSIQTSTAVVIEGQYYQTLCKPLTLSSKHKQYILLTIVTSRVQLSRINSKRISIEQHIHSSINLIEG